MNKIKITSLAEAIMAETSLAEFGFTAVSNTELAALHAENEQLRQIRANVEALLPLWERHAEEAKTGPNGALIAAIYTGQVGEIVTCIQAALEERGSDA